MTRRPAQWLPALFAAGRIALVSALSASMMAPERSDAAREITELTFGPAAGDFCETGHAGHDHHCPFCRLLSDPPSVDPAPTVSRLLPHDGWQRLAGLRGSAQARDRANAARAPPARA